MDAKELRKRLVTVWPPVDTGGNDFDVDIGLMDFWPDVNGMFLDDITPGEVWDAYCRSRGVKRENLKPMLIVVSSELTDDELYNFPRAAIHEFAHLVRSEFSVLYPPAVDPDEELFLKASIIKSLVKYDEVMGSTDQSIWFFLDYYLEERWKENSQFLDRFQRSFDGFPVMVDNYPHDPLFLFIECSLSSLARESGFFDIKTKPVVSATWQK